MSHIRVKTKFKTEGPYGSTEEHTLYAHLNVSLDVTTFYDENGQHIFSFDDTLKNNLLDAMNRLAFPHSAGGGKLAEGVEYMDLDDQKKCGI